MIAWNLKYLVKTILVIWIVGAFQLAESATAYASVTATITQPPPDINGLSLSAMQLDLQGKTNGEIAVVNHSRIWREVRIDVVPMSSSIAGCDLHYSPMTSSIPPGGRQVVRLLRKINDKNPCRTEHWIEISDVQMPGMMLFSVPVHMYD